MLPSRHAHTSAFRTLVEHSHVRVILVPLLTLLAASPTRVGAFVPQAGFAANVYWSGPGGDIWNTNSSPYSPDPANPFGLAWSSSSGHDGQYIRPSGLVIADVGTPAAPYLFGSTGWSQNRPYRASRSDGSYTPWTAVDGVNDSGSGFRVALSLDGSRVFHIDLGPTIRAYPTGSNPGATALWSTNGASFTPGLTGTIKVGPDGRIYGHRSGTAALDPNSGARVWWSAANPEAAVLPGAFWATGATYRYVVAGTSTRVSSYDVQSAAGSAPVWSFTDTESGYAPPTVDPATGAIYVFRSTKLLKLTSGGALAWRSPAVGGGEFGRTYGALSRDGSTYYYQTGTTANAGKLYAFRTSDGTIKWSYATNGYARDWIGGPVVTANRLIFVGNAAQSPGDNRVFCIEDSAGVAPVLRGGFDLRDDGDVGAPWLAIGPDGGLYFDSWAPPANDALFAFRPPTNTAPAPVNLTVTPFVTTTRLRWDSGLGGDVVGYLLYRRPSGSAWPSLPTRYVGPRIDFTDYGMTAGQTYDYRLAACNAAGAQISPFASATVTLLPAATHISRHANRDLLVALYTGGYTPAEVNALKEGLRLGMQFYWRTTRTQLNIQPTWLTIDAPLPGPDWASQAVIDDLRARGIRNDMYDLAYLVGQGLSGCLGGYVVFGTTCASLGTVCPSPYPGRDPAVNYTVAWSFTHEIHHAFEVMRNVAGGTPPEVLTCHFPWAYPSPLGGTGRHIDMATDYDGIAGLNRDYGTAWLTYATPFDGVIECLDADQDGLPDADDRVSGDEARFGSSPLSPDADGDGLHDLAEYVRYNFRGTDPRDRDTDDDGRLDGVDPEPLYPVHTELMPFTEAPIIDAELEATWPHFTSGYYFTQNAAPFLLDTFLGWRPEGLYLAFRASRPLRFKLSLDGSGMDGRWESPVRHAAGATDTDNINNKGAHIGDSWADGRHLAFAYGEDDVRVNGVGRIWWAEVASNEVDGQYLTEAFIPATLPGGAAYTWYPAGGGTPVVNGLTLAEGQVIGVAITVSNLEDSDDNEFSGTWTSLFETLAFVDVTLQSTSGVADPPAARAAAPGIYCANPHRPGAPLRVQVDTPPGGAAASTTTLRSEPPVVEIFDVLGRRLVTLTGRPAADASGLYEYIWDGRANSGRPASTGVYFVRAYAGEHRWQRKVVLMP